MQNLTQEEIDSTLLQGELPEGIRKASEKVAVVWTQDWCPQWQDMKSYLPDFEDQVKVYILEYNLHPQFQRIMEFKEQEFGNDQIPYLRYYFRGELITQTNWIPRAAFQALLKRDKPFSLR